MRSLTTFLVMLMMLVFVFDATAQTTDEDIAFKQEKQRQRQILLDNISNLEDLVYKYPDAPEVPTILYQLGQLYTQKEMDDFMAEMDVYNKAYDNFVVSGGAEPSRPKLVFIKAVDYFKRVIEKYPKFQYNDQAKYSLAYCLKENGDSEGDESLKEEAVSIWYDVIENYPQSDFILDAHFRLAEALFDIRRYDEAVDHYKHVLDYPDSENYNTALYKLAWSYFKMLEHDNALEYFIKSADRGEFGAGGRDFMKESIPYIARTAAETGKYKDLRDRFSRMGTRSYELDVFFSFGKVILEQDRVEEALQCFDYYLSKDPTNRQAPNVSNYMIQAYDKAGNFDRAAAERERFHETYSKESAWALKNATDPDLLQMVRAQGEDNLYRAATYWHEKAQKESNEKKRAEHLEKAIRDYETYVRTFPGDVPERMHELRFYWAEASYDLGRYDDAASIYNAVLADVEDDKNRENAAYNIIMCYKAKQESESGSLDSEKELTMTPTIQKLLDATSQFGKFFPESDRAPEAMYVAANMNVRLARYDEALVLLETIEQYHKTSEIYYDAIKMKGKVLFDKKQDYLAASESFGKLKQSGVETSTISQSEIDELLGGSVYKIAEQLANLNRHAESAVKYEEAYEKEKKGEIGPKALFESVIQYEKAEKWDDVIRVGMKLGDEFAKKSDFAPAGVWHAALAWEKLENWKKAAETYELIFVKWPDKTQAPAALFNEGVAYEKQGDYQVAIAKYEELFNYYNADDKLNLYQGGARDTVADIVRAGLLFAGKAYLHENKLVEARATLEKWLMQFQMADKIGTIEVYYYLGEAATKQAMYDDAISYHERGISTLIDVKEVDKDKAIGWAAKNQMGIGNVYTDQFRKSPTRSEQLGRNPDEMTIEETLVRQATEAYANAAKYALVDVTTEATFKAGDLLEELGDYLLGKKYYNNPPKPNLKEKSVREALEAALAIGDSSMLPVPSDQVVSLKIGNTEYVADLFSEALNLHETNVGFSKNPETDSEWIKKSRQKIKDIDNMGQKLIKYEDALRLTPVEASNYEEEIVLKISMKSQYPDFYESILLFYEKALDLAKKYNFDEALSAKLKEDYSLLIYNIGRNEEDIAQIFTNAPIPKELTDDDEIQAYREALNEKGNEYRDRAVEKYDNAIIRNVEKAILENQWIDKTLMSMNAINPEIYEESKYYLDVAKMGEAAAMEEQRLKAAQRQQEAQLREEERKRKEEEEGMVPIVKKKKGCLF